MELCNSKICNKYNNYLRVIDEVIDEHFREDVYEKLKIN